MRDAQPLRKDAWESLGERSFQNYGRYSSQEVAPETLSFIRIFLFVDVFDPILFNLMSSTVFTNVKREIITLF